MEVWSKDQFKEIWVNSEDEQSMCALINGEYGWLMYLKEEGDTGLTSRNPNYNGCDNKTMKFMLSNGQIDEYPMAWVLSVELVNDALTYFEKTHQLPDFIIWHK